jgi:hypothetical protein
MNHDSFLDSFIAEVELPSWESTSYKITTLPKCYSLSTVAHCQCQSDDPVILSWCSSVQIRSLTLKGTHTQKVQWNWEGIVGKLIAVKSLHVREKDEESEWMQERTWINVDFADICWALGCQPWAYLMKEVANMTSRLWKLRETQQTAMPRTDAEGIFALRQMTRSFPHMLVPLLGRDCKSCCLALLRLQCALEKLNCSPTYTLQQMRSKMLHFERPWTREEDSTAALEQLERGNLWGKGTRVGWMLESPVWSISEDQVADKPLDTEEECTDIALHLLPQVSIPMQRS